MIWQEEVSAEALSVSASRAECAASSWQPLSQYAKRRRRGLRCSELPAKIRSRKIPLGSAALLAFHADAPCHWCCPASLCVCISLQQEWLCWSCLSWASSSPGLSGLGVSLGKQIANGCLAEREEARMPLQSSGDSHQLLLL